MFFGVPLLKTRKCFSRLSSVNNSVHELYSLFQIVHRPIIFICLSKMNFRDLQTKYTVFHRSQVKWAMEVNMFKKEKKNRDEKIEEIITIWLLKRNLKCNDYYILQVQKQRFSNLRFIFGFIYSKNQIRMVRNLASPLISSSLRN